jgi:hypothetical protein
MTALGWITTRPYKLPHVASLLRRRNPRKPARRGVAPRLELLESIEVLSHASVSAAALKHLAAQVARPTPAQSIAFTSHQVVVNATPAATPAQTTQTQTATVPSTLTNFLQPFAPPVALFNPTLGQLISVQVTATASLTSQIKSENTSTTSGADITGFTQGNYQILGLDVPIAGAINNNTQTVTVGPFQGGPIDFTGPSSVTFPPLASTQTQTFTLTQPSDLAFFTQTAARQAITPVLAAVAQAGATAPNGNLVTQVTTSGSGNISVVYNYVPMSPSVTQIVRYGLHHQPTTLLVTFSGPLNAVDASTPANYYIVAANHAGSFTGPGTRIIPIVRATYNPATNQVALVPAHSLNVHYQFQLHVNLPGFNGNSSVIQFGGKQSLGGFLNPHTGQFVPVVNGVIPPQFLG